MAGAGPGTLMGHDLEFESLCITFCPGTGAGAETAQNGAEEKPPQSAAPRLSLQDSRG